MRPVFCVPRGADTASCSRSKARTKAGRTAQHRVLLRAPWAARVGKRGLRAIKDGDVFGYPPDNRFRALNLIPSWVQAEPRPKHRTGASAIGEPALATGSRAPP